jgi:hypothetical protein
VVKDWEIIVVLPNKIRQNKIKPIKMAKYKPGFKIFSCVL